MSKKRKTRKQKEIAKIRHQEELQHPHIHIEPPTYSITNLKSENKVKKVEIVSSKTGDTVAQKDMAYLRHDISAITAASGIIAAVDILLFTALSTGFIHLHFLGY